MNVRKRVKMSLFASAVLLPAASALILMTHAAGDIKPYTVMVYMSGTDLESDYAAATDDIKEMLATQGDDGKMNVIIQTGGTKEWHTEGIAADKSTIIRIQDGGVRIQEESPLENMGDPKTLTSFVEYGMEEFPAEQYALIFWDHGGGAVEGACLDEWYDYDRLTLDEMEAALSETDLERKKLSLVGFDTCLMGTAENAMLFSKYADYMAASEELEPGGGWDYAFLKEISRNPNIPGDELGKKIAEYYYAAYGDTDDVTISVMDLSKMGNLSRALERFSTSLKEEIAKGKLEEVAKIRSAMYEFGSPNSYSEGSNMVDLMNLGTSCLGLIPAESEDLTSAIREVVIQNDSNMEHTDGLSIFFPYRSKSKAFTWLEKYEKINAFPAYEAMLTAFHQGMRQTERLNLTEKIAQSTNPAFDIKIDVGLLKNIEKIYMIQWRQSSIHPNVYWRIGSRGDVVVGRDGTIESAFEGKWFAWQGKSIPLEAFDGGDFFPTYSFPALLNGEKVRIVVEFDEDVLNGRIKGAIPDKEYGMPTRTMRSVAEGDMVQLLYESNLFTEEDSDFDENAEGYQDGSCYYDVAFIVDSLAIDEVDVEKGNYIYGYCFVDYVQNYYLTDFIGITF